MSDLMMFGAEVRRPVEVTPQRDPAADLRSTSHAVTCDYLVGRGLRRCTCQGFSDDRGSPGRCSGA
ncbi:MAG: hypothetical protein EOP01_08495, partial [Propionibacteriaceae bacterium]